GAAEAAKRARDFDAPAATGRYRLAEQAAGSSYGLVLYLPVDGPEGALSIEERRASLRGVVTVVMLVGDMLSDVLNGPVVSGLRRRIHDGGLAGADMNGAAEAGELIYGIADPPMRSSSIASWASWDNQLDRDITVAGRMWRLHFEDAPELNPWLRLLPLV